MIQTFNALTVTIEFREKVVTYQNGSVIKGEISDIYNGRCNIIGDDVAIYGAPFRAIARGK